MVTEFPGKESVYSAKIGEVRQSIPRPDQVRDGEDDTEDNADTSHDNISDAKERIASAHNRPGGDYDGLSARIDVGREIWNVLAW